MKRTDKAERAYQLHLKGLAHHEIAERLGMSANHVAKSISQAKAKREKAKEGVE